MFSSTLFILLDIPSNPISGSSFFLGQELATGVEDVEIYYGAAEPFGQAHTEGIWKNKYERGTNFSISFLRQSYYVSTMFVLKCSGYKWQLMDRGAEQLAADIPDA